jgi:aldehyde dehydrogenase (NAD+)
MATQTPCFIDGADVTTDRSYDNIDPSTGGLIGAVSLGSRAEVSRAARAGRAAQPAWNGLSPQRRADILDQISRRVLDNVDELSRLESEDTGKPISQAVNDVRVCARYFQFYSRTLESFYGATIPMGEGFEVFTTNEPYGVIGHILAWNYPMQLFARAVAPAIATGNAVVVKPADETPRTAVRIAQLAVEAGLPAGILNVVTGTGAETGAALSSSPEVDQIGFVGSTEVGRLIAASAAEQLVPAVLELGGKSPHIVFADADLDEVVPTVVKTIIQNAGQTCSAGSRLLVDRRIHQELVARVSASMERVTVGRGIDDPELGPLISAKQLGRVEGYVNGASGTVVTGGSRLETEFGGSYFAPTLIDGVDPLSRIAQEEVFGPVLVAMDFDRETEAVEKANATDYGLIAAVWTADLDRAFRVSRALRVGQVFVNNFGASGGVELPFGGVKKSGYGREKGVEALLATTQTKATVIKVARSISSP